MPLPPWNADGYLPPGAHRTTWREVAERCVMDSADRERRESIMSAARAYEQRVRRFVPDCRIFICGSITVETPNEDALQVLIVPTNWNRLESLPEEDQQQFAELLTLQDVIVNMDDTTIYMPEVSPLGGMLRTFLGDESDLDDHWHGVFEGDSFGYLEVAA